MDAQSTTLSLGIRLNFFCFHGQPHDNFINCRSENNRMDKVDTIQKNSIIEYFFEIVKRKGPILNIKYWQKRRQLEIYL